MSDDLTYRLAAAFMGRADHIDRASFGEARARIAALEEGLRELVRINEEHNEAIGKIIGKPLDWKEHTSTAHALSWEAPMADDALIEAMSKAYARSFYIALGYPDAAVLAESNWQPFAPDTTAALAAYRQHQQEAGIVEVRDVDTLANIIRTVDGSHSLGAGRLAAEIVRALSAAAQETSDE